MAVNVDIPSTDALTRMLPRSFSIYAIYSHSVHPSDDGVRSEQQVRIIVLGWKFYILGSRNLLPWIQKSPIAWFEFCFLDELYIFVNKG